jgi:hypothetical protein
MGYPFEERKISGLDCINLDVSMTKTDSKPTFARHQPQAMP